MESNKNPILNPNSRMVNGPVNVVRLEGEINGIKKVIYLFMDYHLGLNSQTQCTNIFSQDVQKYFTNSFYELNRGNKTYDFFVEIYPSEVASREFRGKNAPESESKEKYIEEVVRLFRKIFEYDAKKNRVSVNRLFKNVRLHYLDVRDYYKSNFHEKLSQMVTIANKFTKMENIDARSLNKIIDLLGIMRNHLELVVNILSKKSRKVSKQKIIRENVRSGVDIEALEYLANKIKNLYKYPEVKNVMNDLLDLSINNFQNTIKDIDSAIDDFNSYADKLSVGDKLTKDPNTSYVFTYGLSSYTLREMIVDIYNRVEKLLDENFVEFFARFTDIYFLRRFLDKDYITNAIVYSGALHSNTYISILVKHFDFKVTNFSYAKITNLTKLNNEVFKRPLMEIQELFLPEYLDQCSNMQGFPEEFL